MPMTVYHTSPNTWEHTREQTRDNYVVTDAAEYK